VYPDERVVRLVTSEFLPVRVHVKDPDHAHARMSQRLNAHWTPTVLILDEDGIERHRIEGFIPADDFWPRRRRPSSSQSKGERG
jgi:hypothetical protein